MSLKAPNWRHPAIALVAPIVLLAIGLWQLSRIEGAADEAHARMAQVQSSLEQLQALAARDPNAPVRFNNGATFTAALAAKQFESGAAELRHDEWVQRARAGAAWAALAGGVATLFATLLCLGATAFAALRGRRSRTALVGAFRALVRVLPPVLGLIAVGAAVGVIGAVLFEVGGLWFAKKIGGGAIKLAGAGLILAGVAAAFAVNSVRQLRRALEGFTPRPMEVLGRTVSEADAPRLWAFVRWIAGKQGADAPDNIVLGLTEGFFVTSSPIALAPGEHGLSGRSLYLPAALAAVLSPAEITAIVAHELAHFTGEDTQYSERFLPLFAGMVRSVDAVTSHQSTHGGADMLFQPAAVLAGHALDTFDRVVKGWSRKREFEADQAGLRAGGGGRGAATALIRTGVANEIVSGVLGEVYERPDRADPDVVGAVLARATEAGFPDPARHLEDRQPHPTDTHPPTRQRIEALGVGVDDTLLAEAARPVRPDDLAFFQGLFADWPGLSHALGADFLAMAGAHDQRFQAELREAAGAMAEDVPVHEHYAFVVALLGALGAVLLGGGGFFALVIPGLRFNPTEMWSALALAAALGLGGLFLLWVAWRRYRRGRRGPFLVLGAEGFRCDGIQGLVPWSDVDGVRVMTGQRFVTTFHLSPDAPWPDKAGRHWFVKLDRRHRTLELHGYVPRGMKAQAYLDLINRALMAQRAAAALREREADAPRRPTANKPATGP